MSPTRRFSASPIRRATTANLRGEAEAREAGSGRAYDDTIARLLARASVPVPTRAEIFRFLGETDELRERLVRRCHGEGGMREEFRLRRPCLRWQALFRGLYRPAAGILLPEPERDLVGADSSVAP